MQKQGAAEAKPGLLTRQAAANLMARIIDDHRGLDGLLESDAAPSIVKSVPDSDRALLRAIVTTTCRHRGEILTALSKVMNRPPPANARHLRYTLEIAAAQILFMNIPDRAAVDLAVSAIADDKRSSRFKAFANAVLRNLGRKKTELLAGIDDAELAQQNMPSWLWKRVRKDFGKERAALIASTHMKRPPLDLTAPANRDLWLEKIGGIALFGSTIRTTRKDDVASLPGYDEGAWWVQDAAAALPAQLLGNIEGKKVADLCSAPGGKTAQLIMRGARVTAIEISDIRAKRLKQNLDRLKLEAEIIVSDLFNYRPAELYDAVLLDAPCSSTGTIRRHPDVQWSKSADEVTKLAELQFQMVQRAITMIRPGGTLVFSNCSMLREEGEDLFARILQDCCELRSDPISASEVDGISELINKQGCVRTLPSQLNFIEPDKAAYSGLDGFFAARFRLADQT